MMTGSVMLALSLVVPARRQEVPGAPGQPQIIEIHTAHAVGDWAFDTSSGRIFVSDVERQRLHSYDTKSGRKLKGYRLAGKPGRLFVRQLGSAAGATKLLLFELAGDDGLEVYAMDLEKNRLRFRARMPARMRRVAALFGSRAASRYAYALCEDLQYNPRQKLVQIDSSTGKPRKEGYLGTRPVRRAVMSADGRWMLARTSTDTVHLYAVDEEACRFTPETTLKKTTGQLGAGPDSRRWTVGGRLYEVGLGEAVRQFDGIACALEPRLDLAALFVPGFSLTDDGSIASRSRISLERLSTGEPLRTILLPASFRATGSRNVHPIAGIGEFVGPESKLHVDRERQELLFARDRFAYVIDLGRSGLAAAKTLTLALPALATAVPRRQLVVPLRVEDGDAKDVSFRLGTGPRGARISGARLVWTPRVADVGTHRVTIEARAGELSGSATLRIDVQLSDFKIDFRIEGLRVDSMGKRALVSRGLLSAAYRTSRPTELAVVDLGTQEVIARKTMQRGIRTAHLDTANVYLAPGEGKVFYKLSPTTLSELKRVYVEKEVDAFVPVPGSRLAAISETPFQPVIRVYDTTTMEEIDAAIGITPSACSKVGNMTLGSSAGIVRLHQGLLLIGNVVVDPASGQPQFLYGDLPGLPRVKPFQNAEIDTWLDSPRPWNRRILGGGEFTNLYAVRPHSKVTQWNSRSSLVLSRHPLVVSANLGLATREPPKTKIELQFRDVVEGKLLAERVAEKNYPGQPLSTSHVRLHDAGDRVLIAYEKKLIVYPLPASVLRQAPSLLQIVLRQTLDALADRPLTLKFEARGSKGKVRFSLLKTSSKFRLDPDSGALTIDLPRIWKEDLIAPFRSGDRAIRRMIELSELAEDNPLEYKRLTGKDLSPDRFATYLPLVVGAKDEAGREDIVRCSLIVLGPKAELMETLERARVADGRRYRPGEFPKKAKPPATPSEKNGEGGEPPAPPVVEIPADLKETEAAISGLEKSIKEILSKLERLEEKLGP